MDVDVDVDVEVEVDATLLLDDDVPDALDALSVSTIGSGCIPALDLLLGVLPPLFIITPHASLSRDMTIRMHSSYFWLRCVSTSGPIQV